MIAQANCVANVLRGVSETAQGDFIDDGESFVPVYFDQPMCITERFRRVFDPSTGVPRTIRVVRGRASAALVLQETDQILDKTHNRLYSVSTCYLPDAGVIQGDWNLELERVTGGAATP